MVVGPNEQPYNRVRLSWFYLGKFEMSITDLFINKDAIPVAYVSKNWGKNLVPKTRWGWELGLAVTVRKNQKNHALAV